MADLKQRDPLVTALRLLIGLFIGVLAFAMLMLAIGFLAVPFFHGDISADVAKHGYEFSAWQAIAIGELLIAMIFALLGLITYFFVLLWRILATVRQGDPFAPANAQRLSRMAWTAVAGNVWAVIVTLYATWLGDKIAQSMEEGMTTDFDFGSGGAVLILVLFVLARVFRQGTEMRADLEGTV